MRFRTIRLSTIILASCSLSAAAPWSGYPLPSGLDSVRVLKTSTISNPGHTEGSAYLTFRYGRVHVFGDDRLSQADSLGQGKASAVAIIRENCYAGTSTGWLFRQLRCTSDWDAGRAVPDSASIRALAGVGEKIFLGTNKGVYASTWSLGEWQALNTGLANTAITSLVASGNKLYALADSQVFVSSNEGLSWVSRAIVPGASSIRAFAAMANGNLYAGTAHGVYRSTNDGGAWSALNTGLANTTVNDLLDTASLLFVATDAGAYRLDTDGTRWISIDSGLATGSVHALSRTSIYLVTARDNGIWQHPFYAFTTSLHHDAAAPSENFRLFAGRVVSFDLASPSHVSLKAYGLSGKEFSVLSEEWLPAGSHSRTLNVSDVPAGAYVFRMQAGARVMTQKAVLTR